MKKRIDVIASVESFNNLSTFKSVEEMNETIRKYRDVIKASVKRSDVQTRLIALLELLKRHSCKQFGVSYMYKNTIADKLEVSYKTVQRLVKKLEELGMIRQVAMKRKKDMLQTANAIIIQPVEEVSHKTPIKKSKKCPASKTTTIFLKQKIKRRKESVYAANFIAHWVPEEFANLASSFFHSAQDIQEFWKVIKQNNRIVNHLTQEQAFTMEQELTIGTAAIKELVMKMKDNKTIANVFGYFNGIVNNLMDKFYWSL